MKLTLQPSCLHWARQRAGLSIPDLAHKLKIKDATIIAWEQSGELTWSLVEKLANATHTPLGYLFLPTPPTETLSISDFRTIQTQDIEHPSPDLLDTVNEALRRQDWYRDYSRNNGGEPLGFVGSLTLSTTLAVAVKRIRDVIAWRVDSRGEALSWANALPRFIAAVEEAGVLVMRNSIVGSNSHRTLDITEFRGFALSDSYAPLIFINGKDAKAAQMFTLAHELVHIWLGVSGVSNLTLTYAPDTDVEHFCNSVAAELLVPLVELRTIWAKTAPSADRISQTARSFGVSSLVILRRLRDADLIDPDNFRRLYNDAIVQFSQKASDRKEGGGDFYRTLGARLGKRFASALVESTLEGGTPYREAFQLLGVNNAESVRKLASVLGDAA